MPQVLRTLNTQHSTINTQVNVQGKSYKLKLSPVDVHLSVDC